MLSFETEIDFELIGICTHHSDYRLVWGINQQLGVLLTKCDDPFVVTGRKGQILSAHSWYSYINEETLLELYLIKNKVDGKFLLPERSQIDYFLFLRENHLEDVQDLVARLKQVNSVMAAYEFEPSELPSAELIVF